MRPALVLAVLAVASSAAAAPMTFDGGADLVAQARALLRETPVPVAPAPAEVSHALPFGREALVQGRLSFRLTARISPWGDHPVVAYVEVCDPSVVPTRGGDFDVPEYVDACRTLVFDLGSQLKTDLQDLKVRHGARTVASIVKTGYGPELDWGPGGVASRLSYRVDGERIVVSLKD